MGPNTDKLTNTLRLCLETVEPRGSVMPERDQKLTPRHDPEASAPPNLPNELHNFTAQNPGLNPSDLSFKDQKTRNAQRVRAGKLPPGQEATAKTQQSQLLSAVAVPEEDARNAKLQRLRIMMTALVAIVVALIGGAVGLAFAFQPPGSGGDREDAPVSTSLSTSITILSNTQAPVQPITQSPVQLTSPSTIAPRKAITSTAELYNAVDLYLEDPMSTVEYRDTINDWDVSCVTSIDREFSVFWNSAALTFNDEILD